jgi:hypothetical protein
MSRSSITLFATLLGVATAAVCRPAAADHRLSGPYTHNNLSIYLIHNGDAPASPQATRKMVTLQEAMDRRLVTVYETGNVNQLSIENHSSEDIYIQSGDVVKGGRQDRVFPDDFILPSKSGKLSLNSFCVEAGRWTRRGSEAADRFSSSSRNVGLKSMKMAMAVDAEQGKVWQEVAKTKDKVAANAVSGAARGRGDQLAAASPTSMQLALENKEVVESTANYTGALMKIVEGKRDVVGYIAAINGKVNSADVYASNDLFRRMWPKLLETSAVEALAERTTARPAEPPTTSQVQAALHAAQGTGQQSAKNLSGSTQVVTTKTEKSVLFETRDQQQAGAWVHRSVILK